MQNIHKNASEDGNKNDKRKLRNVKQRKEKRKKSTMQKCRGLLREQKILSGHKECFTMKSLKGRQLFYTFLKNMR